MKKILLTILCSALLMANVNAQFNYDFIVKQEAYAPLTGAVSLNDTNTWDDECYKIPVGFSFKMNGMQLDSCNISSFQMMGSDTMSMTTTPTGLYSGFLFMNADMHDRADTGAIVQKSVSPVRYVVDGQSPNRIFKLEIFNAGFAHEYDTYGTNEDSLNLQIWLYEKNNEIEFHFGPSKVTYTADYFNMMGEVPFVYFDELDPMSGMLKQFYCLHGSPSNPSIDSSDSPNDLKGLDSYPADGTVYRFAPKPPAATNVTMINKNNVKVYPTAAADRLFISNAENKPLLYTVVSVKGEITHIAGKIDSNATTGLDVSELANGNYIVQLAGSGGRSAIQFIKI